ncbi:Ig-like domain-containing protein, partial [Gilvimarinus agarilyticus]|uniref:Ig-like domain-containing protein n=1 Tax=Gilvimarinus sp. 2_MG-2023 TaxID=3062666 RepID=UPI001C08806E
TTGGIPRLALNIGGNTVYAIYAGGSGTTELTFTYTVQAGDTDANGISIAANALDANGGTLEGAAGNSAVTSHSGVDHNTNYAVDTTAPTLSSSTPADNATAVAVDGNIVLTFSETVQAGSGIITISDGFDTRIIDVNDAQVSISGNTVTINPTTDLNEDATYNVQMGNGVLTDVAGNGYAGINNTSDLNFTTESEIDTSVVVFDLVNGQSSDHSGRTFSASESYTIYIQVDSDSHVLDSSFTQWTGAINLGADDKIVLVGNGSDILGGPMGIPVTNDYSSSTYYGLTTAALSIQDFGAVYRYISNLTNTVYLWSGGSWASNPNTINDNFSTLYLTDLPGGVRTSQGLV